MSSLYRGLVAGGCMAALALADAQAADGDRLLATLENPAIVTATRAATQNDTPRRSSPAVYVRVTAYQPPQDGGSVVVVVKAEQPGRVETDVGRFGLSLNKAFTPSEPSRTQRFRVPLPRRLATQNALQLRFYIEPSQGQGKGASIEIGGAEIR